MMFYDLCLPVIDDPHLARARVATAIQLGWGAVATAQAATDTLTREDRRVAMYGGITVRL